MSGDSVFSTEHKRTIIWFCFKLGKTQAETLSDMHAVYGDVAPSKATISRCYSNFSDGITDVADSSRPGRPSDDSNVGTVGSILDEHPYSSAPSISNMTWIPKDLCLGNSEKQALAWACLLRWIPHSLSDMPKRRTECQLLVLFWLSLSRRHSTNSDIR